jgi:prephenate dehydrogenase
MKQSVGIIGFGSFGQFMAKHLEPYFKIVFYDKAEFESTYTRVNLEEVCKVDFLVLAVPVQKLESILIEIKEFLTSNTLVIEVCSIKVMPMDLLAKYLPLEVSYLGTHPLFGPKSGANGIKGLNIAICGGRISDSILKKFNQFFTEKLELNVINTTATEHDLQMAYVQGLTHFIAKGFSNMKLPELFLTTASYEHFAKIKDIVSLDSPELYEVIQVLNPYTKKVREEFLEHLNNLN